MKNLAIAKTFSSPIPLSGENVIAATAEAFTASESAVANVIAQSEPQKAPLQLQSLHYLGSTEK